MGSSLKIHPFQFSLSEETPGLPGSEFDQAIAVVAFVDEDGGGLRAGMPGG